MSAKISRAAADSQTRARGSQRRCRRPNVCRPKASLRDLERSCTRAKLYALKPCAWNRGTKDEILGCCALLDAA
jgi:hypothetical protein